MCTCYCIMCAYVYVYMCMYFNKTEDIEFQIFAYEYKFTASTPN